MTPYRNSESGIKAFECGDTWIVVSYKNTGSYKYSSPPLSQHHIEAMKRLATLGDGLGTYINKNRDAYDAGEPTSWRSPPI
jgi:hypothetical protein